MKTTILNKVALASLTLIFSATANAQFGLPNVLGIGKSSGSSAQVESADDVVKNARNSLTSFVRAKLGLIEAMGGSEDLDAQKKLLEGLKTGDAAATKSDLETIVSLDKATSDMISKKTAANDALDAKNKAKASAAMLEYVQGLHSAKKMVSSVTNLSKNPLSLGLNIGSVTYLASELPGVVSSGTSTTSTLFSYLNSNGVDTSSAKSAADGLGT